jgi:hypothetical protein
MKSFLTTANNPDKQPFLPWEIIDEILIYVGNAELAVALERFPIVWQINKCADFNWAIKNGRLQYLKYLNKKGQCTGNYEKFAFSPVCTKKYGLEVVKYCHESIRTIQYCSYIADFAAERGVLDLLKYFHSVGGSFTTKPMDFAARNGNLAIVKRLHANRKEGCTSYAMDYAAENGHLKVLKWLHANRQEVCTKYALDRAAENGHLEVVKWLHANGKEEFTTEAIDCAAENGQLKVVKWLHANGHGCTKYATESAAENGHLEVVKWLNENVN